MAKTAAGDVSARRLSRSGRALDRVLQKGGKDALAVFRTGIHVSLLWRYTTGRGKPGASNAARLHRATKGIVAASGWIA